MARLELEKYVKMRKKFKWIGWIAGLTAIFHIAYPPFPLPIPFRGWLGVYIALGILLAAVGLLYNAYCRPSIKMVGEVAKINNGYLTASCLIDYLNISAWTAEKIIINLFKNGYVDIVNKVNNDTPKAHWACQFIGLSVKGAVIQSVRSRENITDLAVYTANNPEMTVDEINQLLLGSSLNIGSSGQPRR